MQRIVAAFLIVTFVASSAPAAAGDPVSPPASGTCGHGTCGHSHGDLGTLLRLAAQWSQTVDTVVRGGAIRTATPLADSMTGQMIDRHRQRFSLMFPALSLVVLDTHAHGPAEPPKPTLWARARDHVKHFVLHVVGDVVEGVPEFGLIYGTLTLVAEGIDHLVFDEVIPVVGWIPLCVLIAEVARRSSTFVAEGLAVGAHHARWYRPVAVKALARWHRARRAAIRASKQVQTKVPLKGRSPVVVTFKRPGFFGRTVESLTGRPSDFTRLANSVGADGKWIMESSPGWAEVVRRRFGEETPTQELELEPRIVRGLTSEDGETRVRTAYEVAEALQTAKAIASGLQQAAQKEGHLSIRQMLAMRFRVGRVGSSIRKLEREALALAASSTVEPAAAEDLARRSALALQQSREALDAAREVAHDGPTTSSLLRLAAARKRLRALAKPARRSR